jgi:hypothetical protein
MDADNPNGSIFLHPSQVAYPICEGFFVDGTKKPRLSPNKRGHTAETVALDIRCYTITAPNPKVMSQEFERHRSFRIQKKVGRGIDTLGFLHALRADGFGGRCLLVWKWLV